MDIPKRRIFFSPSTRGFYMSDVHADVPTDAIEITEEEYSDIFRRHTKGEGAIIAGVGGRPEIGFLHPPAIDPHMELKALDMVLPRCVEDTWSAIEGFDVRKLPLVTRERLSKKQILRRQIRRETVDR
jgi:hypothetical protein